MKAIHISGATLEYKTQTGGIVRALNNVSLDVEEGEFIALLGHNGSGKSTLAKILNGLLIPRLGEVEIFGVNTKDISKIFEIRSNIGMVFQNPDNQMIASIVEDDIAFGPENLGIPREEIIKRVDWALEKVGMSEHRTSTPFKMSGGQKQRIAIAGILAIKPRIIVFDESTAMLDPQGRKEEAVDCDRIAIMNDARIVAIDTPQNIFKRTELIESCGLDLPLPLSISNSLKAQGIDLQGEILTENALKEEVCKILK